MALKDGASYRISAVNPDIILAQWLDIASITLMLVRFLHFQGGISLKSDNLQRNFNAHPFFMLFGLIFLGGQAIKIYKTVPGSKKTQKFVHLLLHLVALAFGSFGLYAAVKSHRDVKLEDMYSLHSWFGMGTFSLYILQWLIAFFTVCFPGAKTATRANDWPWHAFSGTAILSRPVSALRRGWLRNLSTLAFFAVVKHSQ